LNEIEEYVLGQPLLTGVPPSSAERLNIAIQRFPVPTEENTLRVSGSMLYEFEDGVQHVCDVQGGLVCKQMYSGQRPSLRDRLKQ
jgi:hypothetical protein